jgi:hypothetical protein
MLLKATTEKLVRGYGSEERDSVLKVHVHEIFKVCVSLLFTLFSN